MGEHKKNISRKIGFASTTSEDVFRVSSKIIDSNANNISKLIGRNKISDLINLNKVVNDEKNILKLFSNGAGFDIRFYECLSLAYVCSYSENRSRPESNYVMCVDVDDRYKSQTDNELFFSDGVMAHVVDNEVEAFTPMQQVLAQNLVGRNKGKRITDIIIGEAGKKIGRRNTYNDTSGLIVSVINGEESISMDEIIKSIDATVFEPTFLVFYGQNGNLKTAMVVHLDGKITNYSELKQRSLLIAMPELSS